MEDKLKPIPVNAYICPVCHGATFGTLEEARAHVRTPKELKVPYYGLVFKVEPTQDICVILSSRIITSGLKHEIHDFVYYVIGDYNRKMYEWLIGGMAMITQKEFVEGLRNGKYSLLTPEEFREFKRICHDTDRKELFKIIRRTNSPLEILIAEKRGC